MLGARKAAGDSGGHALSCSSVLHHLLLDFLCFRARQCVRVVRHVGGRRRGPVIIVAGVIVFVPDPAVVWYAIDRPHVLLLQSLTEPVMATFELPADADERLVEFLGGLVPGQALDVAKRDAQPAFSVKPFIGLPEPAAAFPRLMLFGRTRLGTRPLRVHLLVEGLAERDVLPLASRPEAMQVAPLDDDLRRDV